MSIDIHDCSRTWDRNAKVSEATWAKFFAKNPTPFVYLDAEDDSELFAQKNIVGFIKDVEFHHWGISYKFVVINDAALAPNPLVDPFLTIEPVYGSIERVRREPFTTIFGIELARQK